jgi:hypothetical protein
MKRKVTIAPGFPTVDEVAKTLGVTKKQRRTVENILREISLSSSRHRRSGQLVSKTAPISKGTKES